MTRIIAVLLILIFSSNYSNSQSNFAMWYKLSPEIRLNFEDRPFEIRWRPVDYLITPDVKYGRTDIMIGVNFWKFKLFSYSKFDELGRSWTGARLDFSLIIFNKKLLINLDQRYFFGLNKKTSDQIYLVDMITYNITKKIQFGVMSYGQWDTDKDVDAGLLSIGPVVNFILPANFNILVTTGREVFHDGRYITIIRLGYKIFWKDQNKPIDFGI
jgi:hypothetical protein